MYTYEQKRAAYERARRIYESSLEWEQKYDMIFSKEISHLFKFDWYDPDSSYEDDVIAYMQALEAHMITEDIIHREIDF